MFFSRQQLTRCIVVIGPLKSGDDMPCSFARPPPFPKKGDIPERAQEARISQSCEIFISGNASARIRREQRTYHFGERQ